MKHLITVYSLALATVAVMPLPAQIADTVQAPASKVFGERQDSTVRLSVTRKLKGKDQTFEIPAISLDGKGLFVASLNGIESGGNGMQANMLLGGGDDEGDGGPGAAKIGGKADKGELTRVALLRADASEAEADLLITDAALDLALIRTRPAEGKDAIVPAAPPIAKNAPVLLENVLSIYRQGPEFQRVAAAGVFQIAAVVTTPRRFFIPSQPVPGGTPVYNLHGELLGVAASVHDECVIVPADAILKIAASVPAK